jgi:hypothetical protein
MSNILRISAIQELVFLEEDNALSVNEVLEHVLKLYQARACNAIKLGKKRILIYNTVIFLSN